jgi:hypothetical protein
MMVCAFGVQSCSVEDNPAGGSNVKAPASYTYDFAAAAAAEENPSNLNGSEKSGQAFYGWENENKTDSKRQDYKGYKWAAGSVLPEVCHVWRRSDRINGNIKNGGLFCPSDKEMAIDGLKPTSTVQIFYTANPTAKKTSLEEIAFNAWDGWVNANPIAAVNHAWVIDASTGQPYGDPSVISYCDLSAYGKLIVKCTEGTPRFLFNRDIDEGQWAENEEESHLIDNTKGGWSAKYFSSEEADGVTTWTVDIAQMVADKGYAHLHAIKGANWANCTVTSMEVEEIPEPEYIMWAIGTGDAPRATAIIDGEAAISGVTPIASGATITVKSVTPAANSTTGYIVFKVKKNMVIEKIIINNAAE